MSATGILRALSLNGTSAFAEAADTADLNLTGDWTIELWFKDDDPAGFDHDFVALLDKGDRDTNPESPYFVTVGYQRLSVGQRTGWTDFSVDYDLGMAGVDPNAWHHVAATFQAIARSLVLYLDGTPVVQGVLDGQSTGNTLPLQFGRGGPISGKYLQGKLHDVRLWSVVRSAIEISSNRLIELSGPQTGLVANWKFDEASGNTAADNASGNTAVLGGGATFVAIVDRCGLGDAACPDLTVTHSGVPGTIDAAGGRQLTLTVIVKNQERMVGPAVVPVGTRLLQESLPRIDGAAPDPIDQMHFDTAFLSATVRPGTPVNTVVYTGYAAPPGYSCTNPASGVTTVSCSATAPDTIQPADTRVFHFTLSLFDIQHPYLTIADSVVGGTGRITVDAAARASVNPDGSIPELDLTNNGSLATTTVQAPFIQTFNPKFSFNDCLLVGGGRTTETDSSGRLTSVGTWRCGVRIKTARSSAPARLAVGALKMGINADAMPPRSTNGQPVTESLQCRTTVSPDSSLEGSFSCTSSFHWHIACTSTAEVAVPIDSDVVCRLAATAKVPGSPFSFGWSGGSTSGVDVAPVAFFLNPEIIRFASRNTIVKAKYDLNGASVDF